MPTYTLAHVSDERLLADLAALVTMDRQTTAALLAHIGEVDARELYLPAACSSMHVYCTQVLHLADEVAFKRIRAARAARRFPVIFDAIADGRLHVSGVVMLAPHLTDENIDEVVAAATHRSRAELEIIVARLAPRPDLPEALVPIDPPAPQLDLDPVPSQEGARQLVPDPVAPRSEPPARMKALAPERFGLQVTISQATRDKLDRARALLRHSNPSGDLAEVLDRALDALLAKLEKEKFGATSRPRNRKLHEESADLRYADPHYVSNEVRRAVHERDGERCTFTSKDGVRCTERGFLEIDHRKTVARGAKPTVDELRLLCKAHNQYEGERILGADFMRGKRDQAKRRRAERAHRAPEQVAAAEPAHAVQAVADEPGRQAIDEPAHAMQPAAAEPTPTVHDEAVAPARPAADDAEPARFDGDVTSALRRLGFKAAEARHAVEATAEMPATTFEARLRAALSELTRARTFRCSDGPFDLAASGTVVGCG